MRIPRRNLEKFVREVAEMCMISQGDRSTKNDYYKNYFLFGGDSSINAAIYNKTFAYLDDLESLLYSPLSLRFKIGNPDLPNILEEAKGRAAASKLRALARASNTDTRISEAVLWGLVKGKTLIKQNYKRDQFQPDLIQPENFGVFNEAHDTLDEDMEAFTHSMLITLYQFERLIANHPDRDLLRRRARAASGESRLRKGGTMTVTTGGLAPFQPAGSGNPQTRGLVDWMSAPSPILDPKMEGQLLQLDEVWIWDDNRGDWATFQIIGDNIMIMGKYFSLNALAWDPVALEPNKDLKGKHPFIEFSPNRVDGYFWGRSEILNIALLQEAINSRINGTNRILRIQEDPPKKFVGSSGVNQQALARFNKPGGYWVDTNPNAKIDSEAPAMPPDLWGSLHEYERMFDEMGGLPPQARGGAAGVRSQGHAETLVRMFSPRFKDRALLIERDVAALGALMLDIARAHEGGSLTAWVPKDQAGVEAAKENPLIIPPAEGMVAVNFKFADLDRDMTLGVDSHSSSPAFAQDAKNLIFDLFKTGSASKEDLIEHTDAPDPENMIAGLIRREIAAAKAAEQQAQAKVQAAAKHGR